MLVQGNFGQAVSLAEFKRARHVVETDSDDDLTFEAYLSAAQDVVETATNRPLTERTVQIAARNLGYRRWWVPVAPLKELTKVEWNNAGTWTDLGLEGVVVESAHDEPQIVFPSGYFAGVPDGAELRVTASVGFEVVPKKLVQAIILIAGDWYEANISFEKVQHTAVSFGCRVLIRQSKYQRPCEWAAS